MYYRVQKFIVAPILTSYNDNGEPISEVQLKPTMIFLANHNLSNVAARLEHEASAQAKKTEDRGLTRHTSSG